MSYRVDSWGSYTEAIASNAVTGRHDPDPTTLPPFTAYLPGNASISAGTCCVGGRRHSPAFQTLEQRPSTAPPLGGRSRSTSDQDSRKQKRPATSASIREAKVECLRNNHDAPAVAASLPERANSSKTSSTGTTPDCFHSTTSSSNLAQDTKGSFISEDDAELPEWEPPVAWPAPNGGNPKLRFSSDLHHLIMVPACVLTAAAALVYLGWKVVHLYSRVSTTNPSAFIFLTLEWILFLSSLLVFMEVSRPSRDRPPLQIPPKGPFPYTNIFICCCKEPVDIIADTITGAMHQVYPNDRYIVWVLDDGADDELKAHVESEAAEKYGQDRLFYLRREKKPGIPHHFKAGNINHGLNHATGEFVAILDADMIPSPYFLTSLLPHFDSEKVAFVQCPQSFYNVVKGDPLNDTSRDFYDIFLPYRDGRDSAQCVGTGAIFRISALRQNGGFTCGTITEDFDTSLSLHSQGFTSVYVNQKLQAGLAPWSLHGYVKQHQRWCMGSLQLLSLRKPLRIRSPGFDLYHRISYWWAGMAYYVNIFTLLMMLYPLFVLAFDLPTLPYNSPPSVTRLYMALLTPYAFLSRFTSAFLPARYPTADKILIRQEQPFCWNAWFHVVAIFKYHFPLVSKRFVATGARQHSQRSVLVRLRIVWFHVLYITLALAICIWQLAVLDYSQCGRLLKVCGWMPAVFYFASAMIVPVLHVLHDPHHPKPERRSEYLKYTEQGVPYFTDDMIMAKKDWRTNFFHIIPIFWMAFTGFFFFAAIFDYKASFCQDDGFFGYVRF